MTSNYKINSQQAFEARNLWRVLKHNKAAMVSAIVLTAFLGAAI
jgi:hypothetical protein